METFKLGSFLELQAAQLDKRLSHDELIISGLSSAILRDQNTEVLLECTADAGHGPKGSGGKSCLVVSKKHFTGDPDKDLIDLKKDGKAALYLHWPVPLSPGNRGIWLQLMIVKKDKQYRLATGNNVDQSGLLLKTPEKDLEHFSFLQLGGWRADLWVASVSEWVEQWNAWAPDHVLKPIPLDWAQSDLFDASSSAAVLCLSERKLDNAVFTLAFEEDAQTEMLRLTLHLRAMLDDTGGRLAARAVLNTDRIGEPLGPVFHGTVQWTCRAYGAVNAGHWVHDWSGFPTAAANGAASANRLWQLVTAHYGLGLRSLRQPNALSFMPGSLLPAGQQPVSSWTLRFLLEGKNGALESRLAEMLPEPGNLDLELPGVGTTANLPVRLSVHVAAHEQAERRFLRPDAPLKFIDLAVSPASAGSATHECLISGVLLALATPRIPTAGANHLRAWMRPPEARFLGQRTLNVELKLALDGKLPRPANQDAERGYESESSWRSREPSIVWDLADPPAPAVIEIEENARTEQSRRLLIQVRPVDQAVSYAADAVVIDREPFLVARVMATSIAAQDGVFASYRDDPDYPGGWEFTSSTGAVHVVLPPQAIGEEMIKGMYDVPPPQEGGERVPVPIPGKLFDHRLSPPAQLQLDRNDIDTARVLAPWALRRLLDRRLGAVGARLLQARFELLYGLTAVFADDDPERPLRLRLAESDALVGVVPFASRLRGLLALYVDDPASPNEPLVKYQKRYAKTVTDWIRSLLRRPAQLPVFHEWTARERLVIRDGLHFELRESRQTANPFRPEEPSVKHGEGATPQWLPLRGGVDWGFESRNIYDDFVKSGRPRSADERRKRGEFVPHGEIAGLHFGGLGGSGGQKAVFDNGKTQIISETTQGRLDSLTIVRTGRIAMLWHRARHVIVYERSTRTAPRYRKPDTPTDIADQQPSEFEGMAALRKVKEYIEITQPRRSYPDFPTAIPTQAFCKGVFFETTTIPVKSSWGRDVPGGWVMHLRGPMIAQEEPFYPCPKIFGELARADGKGGGTVGQECDAVELLRFFSSTRDEDGSDTDLWPAVPDVDFPLTLAARPPTLPFTSSFAGANRQPDAEPTDFGQRRFSLHLKPASEAVNLMHGRPFDGLEARVRNVSVARGAAKTAATMPPALSELERLCADHRAVLAEGLTEIATRVAGLASPGQTATDDVDSFVPQAKQRLQELGQIAQLLQKAAKNAVPGDLKPWKTHQKRLKSLAETMNAQLLAKWPDAKDAFWTTLWESPRSRTDASQRIAQFLGVLETRVRDRMSGTVSVPQIAVEAVHGALARTRSQTEAIGRGARMAWLPQLAEVKGQFTRGLVVAADASFRTALDELRAQLTAAPNQIHGQVANWLGALGDVSFAAGTNGPAAVLAQAVIEACDSLTGWIDDALEYTPPFEYATPDWAALEQLIPEQEQLEALFDGWFAAANALSIQIGEMLATHWSSHREAKMRALRMVFSDGIKAVEEKLDGALARNSESRTQIAEGVAGLKESVKDHLGSLTDLLSDTLVDEFKQLGSLPALDDELEKITGTLERLRDDFADLPLPELRQRVESALGEAQATLGHMADRVEREVVTALVERAEGAVQPALQVTRALAEGLVTDTIRCSREWLGYYFNPEQMAVEVTRATAVFNEMGQETLNSLAAQVPFDRIRDRLIAKLDDFDLNKLFPSFAGLQLEHLLGELKVPKDPLAEYDWLKVTHGFDKNRLTAWADVQIDKTFDGETELFDLSPVALAVVSPRFWGHSRIGQGDGNGQSQSTKASLKADWAVKVNQEPVMTIENGTLQFDQSGKLDFDFSANDVRLAPALEFITDALKILLPADSGLTLLPVAPGGVRTELSLPLPDIGTGAFTMTGITLNTYFELLVVNGFEVSTGLWLSKPDRPFGLAILFLGGGGWFGVDVRYRPPSTFKTRVSIGISAGAFIALNLSVIHGSAGVLFTAGLDYYRNSETGGGGELAISVGILVWGEFSILSFVSAYLRLVMRIEYREGQMTGYGRVSVSIKICWCYTFRFAQSIAMPFRGGGRTAMAAAAPRASTEELRRIRKESAADAVRKHLSSLSWS